MELLASERLRGLTEVPLLSSFHQRRAASQLHVGPSANQVVSDLLEATATRERQRRLLRLVGLAVDVCACITENAEILNHSALR